MNSDKSSHRQILRSSPIIGGASVINILIGLLRVKVVAVLLGLAGSVWLAIDVALSVESKGKK